ncbi:MAG: beta-ketoacyl synthase N-terminal-like domain-containing protein [Planctomycetota bacterium]|nr:beta-ketoacyl synthase N-terminal-like domain-containing protein [Planctomycetota bacterium]
MALDVAVTATALRTALGDDPREVWQRVVSGATALAPIEGFDASGFGAPSAAQVWHEPEDAEDDPALRILGPHGRLFEAVSRAAHSAGGLATVPRERVGLFVGMGMVDAAVHDLAAAAQASRDATGAFSLSAFFAGGYRSVHPLWPLSMLGNVAVGQVAIDLDIRGDNLVLSADADAGLRALLEAARSVARGDCDAALAGGASGRITPATLARLALEGQLLGVAPAEGAGACALVRHESDVVGTLRILGGGSAFGPRSGQGPDAAAMSRAMIAALAEGQRSASSCRFVFHHGADDDEELAAVAAQGLAGARAVHTKRHLGHAGTAAPAIDLALAQVALRAEPGCALILASGSRGGTAALLVEVA